MMRAALDAEKQAWLAYRRYVRARLREIMRRTNNATMFFRGDDESRRLFRAWQETRATRDTFRGNFTLRKNRFTRVIPCPH